MQSIFHDLSSESANAHLKVSVFLCMNINDCFTYAVLLLHGSFENIFQEKIYSLHNIERLFYEIKKYSRRRGSYFKQ